jgi:hypothetical protein
MVSTEFDKRLEANIRESLRFAVGQVDEEAVAHMVAGVNAVLNHPSAPQEHVGGLPPADAMHKLAGWTLEYDFVDQLARKAEEETGYTATMEVVEFVALAIAERLQANPAPQPNVVGPVAYISTSTLEHLKGHGGLYRMASPNWPHDDETVPLYTHPMQVKPLRFEAQNVDKTSYASEVSITGEYHVRHIGSSWEVSVRGLVVAREHTSEKAINAAQAHHADKVLSALASEGQSDA